MKTFRLFVFLTFSAFTLVAQVPEPKWIGDTLGPWTIIDFEENSPYIQNSPSMQNMWQIGAPQKQIFSQAYSVPNAIVTGLQSFYQVNNHSAFDLMIGTFNTNWEYPWNIFIDFRHKLDTDTLRDGGYITVSWDHGQSWSNILDDSLSTSFFDFSPSQGFSPFGNTNLYTLNDTLFNGEPGFSGTSTGWVHSSMAWYILPVKRPAEFPPDTMILRFNFISDNLDNNREGWMIDNIRIFSIDLGSGIQQSMAGSDRIRVTRNPLTTSTGVMLDKPYDQVGYMLVDANGKPVSSGRPGKCSEFTLHRANLPHGLYLLKVNGGNGSLNAVTRIVIL